MERWTASDAADLYGVRNWGCGYFHVSPDGELCVRLGRQGEHTDVSPHALLKDLRQRGIALPMLLRFSDLLDARIEMLNEQFSDLHRPGRLPQQYFSLVIEAPFIQEACF